MGLTPAEQAVSKVLIAEGILGPAVVKLAEGQALEYRAAGKQADLIGVLVTTGKIDQATAQRVMKQAASVMQAKASRTAAPPQPSADPGPPPAAPTPPSAPAEATPSPKTEAPSRRTTQGRRAVAGRKSRPSERQAQPSDISQRRSPVGTKNPLPLIVLGVCALIVTALGLAVALKPKPKPKGAKQTSPTPTPSKAATPPPPALPHDPRKGPAPKPSLSVKAALRLKALEPVRISEAKGDYATALVALDGIDEKLRGPAFGSRRARLERYQRYAKRLDAALAGGKDSRALKRIIRRLADQEIEEDLSELVVTARFREKAIALLGKDRFEAIGLGDDEASGDDDDQEDRDDDEGIALPTNLARKIEKRGSEARRARFASEAKTARGRVDNALAALKTRRREEDARWKAERARALKKPKLSGGATLLDYDRQGITVSQDGSKLRFSWEGAPPALSLAALWKGVDKADKTALLRLLKLAILKQDKREAQRAYTALTQLGAPGPNPKNYEPFGKVIQVKGTLDADKVDLSYGFDDEVELFDWESTEVSQHRIKDKQLRMSSKLAPKFPTYSWHKAIYAGPRVEISVTGTPDKGARLLVLCGDAVIAIDPKGVWAGVKLAKAAKDPVTVACEPDFTEPFRLVFTPIEGVRAKAVVTQGEATLFEGEVLTKAWPVAVGIGASGQGASYDRVELKGVPDPEWLGLVQDKIPFTLEQALWVWDVAQVPDEPQLDVEYAKTSAEDEVGLKDIPPAALKHVANARARLEILGGGYAAAPLRAALAEASGRGYWAAHYLLARIQMSASAHATTLEGPRIRLDQAIAGIEGFYEALAARSELALEQGRTADARRDAEAALKLRPDYPLARKAMAYVLLAEGKLEAAMDEILLAQELSGRLVWKLKVDQLRAVRDGPDWWNDPARIETPDYVLTTDLKSRAPEFKEILETFLRTTPSIFPCLTPRPGAVKRRARVYVFKNREDYRRYSYRVSFDRSGTTAGVFTPSNGTLRLDASVREAAETLRHEMTHQWIHSMGLELPYWSNEAVADYVGGFNPKTKVSALDPAAVDSLRDYEEPPLTLFKLMTQSPGQFYSGETFLKYSLAWSFVHFCMESDYPQLKETWFAYLKEHTQGLAGDTKRQTGSVLEGIYGSTFHQLGIDKVTKAWWAYVRNMCEKVPPKSERDKKD